MALSTTCPPDPDWRTQIRGFTRNGRTALGPGPGMAQSALKGLPLSANQGAGSIGPAVAAAPSVALKMHTEASAADGEPMDVIDTTTEQKQQQILKKTHNGDQKT